MDWARMTLSPESKVIHEVPAHSEMIERVARALCNEIGVPEDGLVAEDRNSLDDLKPAWVTQLPKALAAIAAMREPTPEIAQAGEREIFAQYEQNVDWDEAKEVIENIDIIKLWNAMCDAALISP